MSELPVIKGRELVKFLESIGFRVARRKVRNDAYVKSHSSQKARKP